MRHVFSLPSLAVATVLVLSINLHFLVTSCTALLVTTHPSLPTSTMVRNQPASSSASSAVRGVGSRRPVRGTTTKVVTFARAAKQPSDNDVPVKASTKTKKQSKKVTAKEPEVVVKDVEKVETIRKKELVAALSEEMGSSISAADKALSAVLDIIVDSVAEGKKVSLPGFGNFELRFRAARKGRNPRTGEEIEIEASKIVGFSAGKSFKDRINGRE